MSFKLKSKFSSSYIPLSNDIAVSRDRVTDVLLRLCAEQPRHRPDISLFSEMS